MKYCLGVVLFLTAMTLQAGGYYKQMDDGYDPHSGFYFLPQLNKPSNNGIFSSSGDRRVDNIAIFDPATEQHRLLFKPDRAWNITVFTFEMALSENQQVEFFGRSYRMLNNQVEKEREIKDKLLIVTEDQDSEQLTLWFANKQGQDLKAIYTFHRDTRWHIDVKNSKIRFITRQPELGFHSINW
ncbi:hypothetical protein [Motilimonas pumila]|uniref:Uncharacterized protein n=1 Tax=Motilimonas pumila TaxID=2303987 RepID=A0A418YJQ0_9GAMM|nr:hypothetical protein [Motilimonas pumila]RJG51175.1 hypothetical protein D1Z90_00075 [Motilimonas pumila]